MRLNKRIRQLHFIRTGLDYGVFITRDVHGVEYSDLTPASVKRLFRVIHATKWERMQLTGNPEFAQMGVSCRRRLS